MAKGADTIITNTKGAADAAPALAREAMKKGVHHHHLSTASPLKGVQHQQHREAEQLEQLALEAADEAEAALRAYQASKGQGKGREAADALAWAPQAVSQ